MKNVRLTQRGIVTFVLGAAVGIFLATIGGTGSMLMTANCPVEQSTAGKLRSVTPRVRFLQLMRAAGVPTDCATTWPGLLKAESPAEAHCPWLGPWPVGATLDQPKRGISASLTTYVARWQKNPLLLISALWTLLNQTLTPDAIYLALPKLSRGVNGGKMPFDPKWIALIESFPRVHILHTVGSSSLGMLKPPFSTTPSLSLQTDYGPASKFLTALISPEVPNDTLLYVCDDDRRIPTRLIEALARWARRPGYERSGFGVWGISGDHPRYRVKGGPGPGSVIAEQWSYNYPEAEMVPNGPLSVERPPVPVELLLGTNGYLIPKAPFAKDLQSFFRVPPEWRVPFWSEDGEDERAV